MGFHFDLDPPPLSTRPAQPHAFRPIETSQAALHQIRRYGIAFVNMPDGVHAWVPSECVPHARRKHPDMLVHALGEPVLLVDNTRRPRRRLPPNLHNK